MAATQRIYAGTAGGKKYFWGDDGKLFDEAGIEQTDQYAEVLKANFPKPAKQPQSNTTNPQPQQNNQPGKAGYSQSAAENLLRIAFPELYKKAKKIRDAAYNGVKKKKKKTGDDKGKKDSDKKQDTRKLSLSIDTIASNVRTNGTLLQQQLAIQERSLDLLQKLANGTKNGGSDKDGGGGWKAKLAPLLKYAIPTIGALGVGAAGAAALYMSKSGKEHAKDIWHEEDLEKYGPEKADELKRNREMSTLDRIKSVYDRIPTARQPIKEAKDRAKGILPSQPGDTQHDTKAIAEAKQRKPAGKTLEIKGDLITFEAKTIRMDARTLTINSTSTSSTRFGTGNNTDVSSNNKPSPDDKADTGQMPQYDQMGNPLGTTESRVPDAQTSSSTGTPAGAVNKSDVVTPNSPGATLPGAPGQGSIQGGKGAQLLSDPSGVLDPKNPQTAETIRKGNIAPGASFTPGEPLGASGGVKTTGPAMPKNLDDETKGAMNDVAKKFGVSPAAIAGVIDVESKWNPKAGTGRYKGLTQIGPDTFREAPGGKLAGMTFAEFQKASKAQQIKAYGAYLDHYKMAQQAKKYGIDLSKLSPERQAAFLQGMQFAPNASDWKKRFAAGDYNVPTTTTKQASALGSTSIADMEKHFKKRIGKVENLPAKDIDKANAENTKNLTGGNLTSDMMNPTSIADMKGMGGIGAAKEQMETKENNAEVKRQDDIQKSHAQEAVSETNKTARGDYDIKPDLGPNPPKSKFTDELIENKLNEEAGIQRWLGWKQIGPGVQRRKQLEQDPWNSEPGWDSSIKQAPGEIPERDSGPMSSIEGESSNSNDVEKASGSPNKISNAVNGAKKPKTIRKVDVGKYYPQYNKSDFGDPNINSGIGVA